MFTIELTFPIQDGDQQITELTMRRPNVRDHIWLEHQEAALQRENKVLGPMEKDLKLYARLTDQPLERLYKLDIADLGKLRENYLGCVVGSSPSEAMTEID